ncbi:MAG TPA: HAMP domain-containing sensor histidine kinase, partial [Streptosporangiaceae bacterium]|nr:HAMP domain-containing sensor histidine kinase [Streptosporangiaceae bacterium]
MRRAGRLGAAGAARRRPVRLRLTLVYSGLFLAAGAALLAVTYGLVAQSLSTTPPPAAGSQASQYVDQALQACKSENLDPVAMAKCENVAEQSLNGVSKASEEFQRSRTLAHLLDYSLAALAAIVVTSAWLGWIVAGRALRPVHAITAAARRASEENLGERIALAGPDDELKELADTFDAMLGRLDAAFASQRRFVANASHELRTPLTVMRTAIDVTLAKPTRTPAQLETMAVEVRHAADRAEALIEALLTLARSDRGTEPREPLDVAVLAEDALDAAAPAIRAHPVTVQAVLAPAPAVGDPVLVERLVTNLIDNAVRHNVPDGWVQVATGTRAGMAFIDVANGGPLIPPELVPSLFEPFRRLSDRAGSPDGMGLGLSIVRSVALAHRGYATARPRPAGGLEITVSL